jgi:hypothetical protein
MTGGRDQIFMIGVSAAATELIGSTKAGELIGNAAREYPMPGLTRWIKG